MSISDYVSGFFKDIWTVYVAAQPSGTLFSQSVQSLMSFG